MHIVEQTIQFVSKQVIKGPNIIVKLVLATVA